MTLKDFKDQVATYVTSGKVTISGIGGKEDQDYGEVLRTILWYVSTSNKQYPMKGSITLTNLTADSAGNFSMGITLTDSGDSSDLQRILKAAYEGPSKSNFTFSNNIAKWTMPKDVPGSGGGVDDTTARKEQIKQNIMGKIPIQSLLGGVKTSYTESDEEKTNILVEEINRIKTLLNGRI